MRERRKHPLVRSLTSGAGLVIGSALFLVGLGFVCRLISIGYLIGYHILGK